MPRINHFIVLMLENRSFDHLFGFFPRPGGLDSVEETPATQGQAAAAIEAKLEATGLWEGSVWLGMI